MDTATFREKQWAGDAGLLPPPPAPSRNPRAVVFAKVVIEAQSIRRFTEKVYIYLGIFFRKEEKYQHYINAVRYAVDRRNLTEKFCANLKRTINVNCTYAK
jgi:hypothetical protein